MLTQRFVVISEKVGAEHEATQILVEACANVPEGQLLTHCLVLFYPYMSVAAGHTCTHRKVELSP
jgi:hypothetical protein